MTARIKPPTEGEIRSMIAEARRTIKALNGDLRATLLAGGATSGIRDQITDAKSRIRGWEAMLEEIAEQAAKVIAGRVAESPIRDRRRGIGQDRRRARHASTAVFPDGQTHGAPMTIEIANLAGVVAAAKVDAERAEGALADAEAHRDVVKGRITEKQAERSEIVAARKAGVETPKDGAQPDDDRGRRREPRGPARRGRGQRRRTAANGRRGSQAGAGPSGRRLGKGQRH